MHIVRCTIRPCNTSSPVYASMGHGMHCETPFILHFFPLSMSLWFSGGFLQKKVLVEGENFFFLPVVVWKVFTSWYGVAGLQGGPALPRLVCSFASALSFLQSLPPSLPLSLSPSLPLSLSPYLLLYLLLSLPPSSVPYSPFPSPSLPLSLSTSFSPLTPSLLHSPLSPSLPPPPGQTRWYS